MLLLQNVAKMYTFLYTSSDYLRLLWITCNIGLWDSIFSYEHTAVLKKTLFTKLDKPYEFIRSNILTVAHIHKWPRSRSVVLNIYGDPRVIDRNTKVGRDPPVEKHWLDI